MEGFLLGRKVERGAAEHDVNPKEVRDERQPRTYGTVVPSKRWYTSPLPSSTRGQK